MNVPLALVGVVGALLLVPPSKAEKMGRIDYVGGLLSIVTVGSLVYATIEGPHFGWGVGPVTAVVVAAVGLPAFVAWELRHPHPMLNVRKFKERPFSGSMLAVLFFFFGTFGSIYYSTQFLQFVLGYNALETGVRLLPLAGAVFVGAAVTGRLGPKLGVKLVVGTGMVIGTAGVFLLTQIESGSTYTDFLAPLLMLGFAIGLSLAPATDTIMGSFPESELGVGGGANDTALELGGSLGIAILGSLLATSYKDKLTGLVGGHLPGAATDTATDSVGGGLAVAQQVAKNPDGGPQQAQILVDAVHESFAHAIAHTSLIGGIIMAAGTVVVLLVLPGGRTAGEARPGGAGGAGGRPGRGVRRLGPVNRPGPLRPLSDLVLSRPDSGRRPAAGAHSVRRRMMRTRPYGVASTVWTSPRTASSPVPRIMSSPGARTG